MPRFSLILALVAAAFILQPVQAQFTTSDAVELVWTLDPREHPDLFRGPAHGSSMVEVGMDLDGDGRKEILFATDESLAQGDSENRPDVFLYEATGDDTYEYVWHYTHPEGANSWPAVQWGDIDEDGLYEIYFGIPTVDDANTLFIFEQDADGTFPDEPTALYDFERSAEHDFRPSGIHLADVDDDGTTELIVVSRQIGQREMIVSSLVGDDLNAFAVFTIEYEVGDAILGGGFVSDIDVVDFDGDGQNEIWVNTWDNFTWSVFEATGADTYELSAEINGGIPVNDPGTWNRSKHLFTDVDGDGRLELYAAMTDGKLYFLPSLDDVSQLTVDDFSTVGAYEANPPVRLGRGADIGDFTGDGNIDIVANHGEAEKVSLISYDGEGDPADSSSYTWSIIFDAEDSGTWFYPMRIADDLDGDGMNEIVMTNRYASEEGQPLLFVLEWTGEDVSTEDPSEMPAAFQLEQNYPNPFNPTTTIEYVLSTSAQVAVRIYDVRGREVTTLVGRRMHAAGRYAVEWNGRDASGDLVPSGLYFYSAEVGEMKQTKKMVLMK